jgi:hypothetical protein
MARQMSASERSAGTRVVALDRIVCEERALPREGVDAGPVAEFAGVYRDELPAVMIRSRRSPASRTATVDCCSMTNDIAW